MGLIGRLEDLPLTDIIQIVFLSRRTGILELKKPRGPFRIYFMKGYICLACKNTGIDMKKVIRESEFDVEEANLEQASALLSSIPEGGIGDVLLEMNLISPPDLVKIIFSHIHSVITEIMQDEEGEFAFELRDHIAPGEIGYTPDKLFKQGGIPPEKIVVKADKIGVLKEIRETLVKGKETFRAAAKAGQPVISKPISPVAKRAEEHSRTVQLEGETALIPIDLEIQHTRKDETPRLFGKFTIHSKDTEDFGDLGFTACMLEGDPLLRVTLKRIFSKGGFRVFHYNQPQPFMKKLGEVISLGDPLIILLGVSNTIPSRDLEETIQSYRAKYTNNAPIVVTHASTDPRAHQVFYRAGADLVLTRPNLTTLSVKDSEEVLNTFVEDVMIAIQRYIQRLPEFSEKKKFHDIAAKERLNRSLTLLKSLILELTNPEDTSQVGLMTLRLAAEYLERSVILLLKDNSFLGIGGFGQTGDELPMNIRVRNINIPADEDSILNQIMYTLKPHYGKLRRTKWNEYFLNQLGKVFPNEVAVFPIIARGRLVGILYGDNAEYKDPIGNTDGLEIFLSQAGYVLEDVLKKLSMGDRG